MPTPTPPAALPPAPPVAPPTRPTAPLRWAGTTLSWEHTVQLSLLGIGTPQNVSASGTYNMGFGISPGFFAFWHPRHQIRFSTRIAAGMTYEKVDTSGSFTLGGMTFTFPGMKSRRTSFDMMDLPITFLYSAIPFSAGAGTYPAGPAAMLDPTMLGAGDYRTWIMPVAGISFPTSASSRGVGIYATARHGLSLRQQIRILGGEAPSLQHVFITASEVWTHQFARAASTVASPDTPFVPALSSVNQLAHTASIMIPVYRGLELTGVFGLQHQLPRPNPDVCINLGGTCIKLPFPTEATTTTQFSVDLAYRILRELSVRFVYASVTAPSGTVANNGVRTGSFFFSPYAVLHADLTLSFDELFQRFTTPR